jgi:hypothetical protein
MAVKKGLCEPSFIENILYDQIYELFRYMIFIPDFKKVIRIVFLHICSAKHAMNTKCEKKKKNDDSKLSAYCGD